MIGSTQVATIKEKEREKEEEEENSHTTRERCASRALAAVPPSLSFSGALDITEDVGMAVAGAPNLAKLWHHAYRKELVHEEEERSRSPHAYGEGEEECDRGTHSSGSPSPSVERHSPQTVMLHKEEEEDEQAPLLASQETERVLKVKKPLHPFVKMVYGVWPFGESFRALRIWGKLYEIVKVHVA